MNEQNNGWTPETLATDLATAKAGQWVSYWGGGFSALRDLRRIHRTTATIISVGGTDYNRKGHQRGSRYSSSIECVTPEVAREIVAEHLRHKMVRQLQDVKWQTLPDETLKAVCVIVFP